MQEAEKSGLRMELSRGMGHATILLERLLSMPIVWIFHPVQP